MYGRIASSKEAELRPVRSSAWRKTADLVRRDAAATALSFENSALESLTVTVGIPANGITFNSNCNTGRHNNITTGPRKTLARHAAKGIRLRARLRRDKKREAQRANGCRS